MDAAGHSLVKLLMSVKQERGMAMGAKDNLFVTYKGAPLSNSRLANILVAEFNQVVGVDFHATLNRVRHSSVSIVSSSKFKY